MTAALDLAQRLATRLARIDGVVAVVLGGSWARGDARSDSDIDLGIYYRPERPPSVAALRALARELDDRDAAADVTDYGAWGPWINGGAWLQIEGWHVDWLYRDLDRVQRAIDSCRAGQISLYYQPGHPHAFLDAIYMGEIHLCRPLSDPEGAITRLKAQASPYPQALKRALLDRMLWEADFSLAIAAKPALRGDAVYVAGCLYRAAACLAQALFALNERYLINEKGAVTATESLPLRPERFAERLQTILSAPGAGPQALLASIERLAALLQEARTLAAAALGQPISSAWLAGPD